MEKYRSEPNPQLFFKYFCELMLKSWTISKSSIYADDKSQEGEWVKYKNLSIIVGLQFTK